MKVTVFDYYDEERDNPVEMKLKDTTVKKGEIFKKEAVSYQVTKVFKSKKFKGKCVVIKMVAYKIANTVTKFSHKCTAKKKQMELMDTQSRDMMVEKYGEKSVSGWENGRVKMKGHLTSVCPDCGCVFFKDKEEQPEPVEIVSLKGRKKLVKRS